MKTLRRISAATILCLILSTVAFAGHMETPGAPAPAPATGTSTTSTSSVITPVLLTILSLIR